MTNGSLRTGFWRSDGHKRALGIISIHISHNIYKFVKNASLGGKTSYSSRLKNITNERNRVKGGRGSAKIGLTKKQ